MMEERLPLWEASGQGIIADEIIASIVDLKKNSKSPVPEWKGRNDVYRYQF